MLDQVIQALTLRDDGVYVDATAGAGGHCGAILQHLGEQGRLLGIDRDPTAVKNLRRRFADDPRVEIVHSPFSQLQTVISERGLIGKVDGVLVDLGVSSMQLDQGARGFSFMRDGSLDMRMDNSVGLTLSEWLAAVDETTLIRVLRDYGEERFAKKVARAILERHRAERIDSTLELAEVVAQAIPRHERNKHPATRTFQALRIALNDELGELKKLLAQIPAILAQSGRLVVLSFHSLEDRVVKQFIREQSETAEQIPLDLPVTERARQAPLTRVRSPKKPGSIEVRDNPRSRSVIMRVAERTASPMSGRTGSKPGRNESESGPSVDGRLQFAGAYV